MSGGLAGGGVAATALAPLALGSGGCGGDASRRPAEMRAAASAETPTASHSRCNTASSTDRSCPPLDQVGQVVVGVRVGDRAREEGVGRVVGVVLVGGEEGRQPRLGQRHGPGLAEVIRTAGLGVLAQDQPGPVERTRQHPGRLGARPLRRLDLDRAPLLPEHRAGEGGDESNDDHRGQQGGALRPALDRVAPSPFAPPCLREGSTGSSRKAVLCALRVMGRAGCRAPGCRSGHCRARRRGPGARRSAAPGSARRRRRRRRRSTGSSPSRCPGRSRPATGRAHWSAPSVWPGSLPWNCWVRSQLSCRAVVVVTGGPAQRCHIALLLSGRSDHATTCMPPSARRVRRTVWPSQVRAGTAVVCCSDARSCSHCEITVSRRRVCSSRTWFESRARTMPSTPCQASSDMIAMMTTATSTSISVKPRRRAAGSGS